MPSVVVDPTLTMYYEDECYADPWREPEVVLLIHGASENNRSWFAWVPHLARELRVLRPDLRGFGRSTVPGEGYPWSPAGFAADLARFLDALAVEKVHVVGAKVGGTIALQFAADYPERTRTLSVLSGLVRGRYQFDYRGYFSPLTILGGPAETSGQVELGAPARIREVGHTGYAAESQSNRLGSGVPPEHVRWWNQHMATANTRVLVEVSGGAKGIDMLNVLPRIKAPTQVFTAEQSPLAPVVAMRAWQERIPNSRLVVLPGDGYHVAASRPDECARYTMDFIREQR